MLKVWTDASEAGFLDRNRGGSGPGASFAYSPRAAPQRAVSLSMPPRLASYEWEFGLHPIFEMNLPEGLLRERLRLAFAKATGRFDHIDLLSVTGRSQIGRIRYTGPDASLADDVPFQSVDEILTHRRGDQLFSYLLDRFAAFSGVSGVQPKVLIRDDAALPMDPGSGLPASTSIRGATHIVKFWLPDEFPQLAANEWFCLRAAAKAGLKTPHARLAEDAAALVVDRFDLRPDGSYRGVEDFCALNGRPSADKYRGGYERSVFKRLRDFVTDPEAWEADARKLFALFIFNCAIRNGDAHLKNFALIYDDVCDTPRLAPAYDLVTTTAYLPADQMALTLNAKPAWPTAAHLDTLGTTRCGLTPSGAAMVRERTAEALSETLREMKLYSAEHPEFQEIAARMSAAWEEGIRTSLGFSTSVAMRTTPPGDGPGISPS